MEKSKPVGIWIRVSTEDQAKGESPEHHEKRARYYAESKCFSCYWNAICMLTEGTRTSCGGPWKNHTEHIQQGTK